MSDDLVSRLKRLARIARRALETNKCMSIWCADPDTLDAAATALTEARAEIERLRAQFLITKRSRDYQKDRAVKARSAQNDLASGLDHWKARTLAAESELATLRDMLVLCGELGGMGKDETPADYLRRLIDEVAGVESLRARVREVVGPLIGLTEDFKIYGGCVGAARQLMEEVK